MHNYRFFKKLFLGHPEKKVIQPSSYYKKQIHNLKIIWNNRGYHDFGVERLLRLTLQLIAFVMPASIIRELSGRTNLLYRKLSIEVYVLFKFIYCVLIFEYDLTANTFAMGIAVALSIDTLYFLVARIFLSDVFRQEISYKRSLLMTFLNFFEITLCFAVVYAYIDQTHQDVFEIGSKLTDLQVIYFSLITSATIGYGDITSNHPLIMKVVIAQIVISLFMVVIIISNINSKMENTSFYNDEEKIVETD